MAGKAQVSSEFFMFVGLAFLVAITFGVVSIGQLNDFRLQKESEAVRDIALKLHKELSAAAAVEDGYVRVFQIPGSIDNINYSVTTQNSTITVKSKNSIYIVSIPKVSGNITKGANTINKTGGIIQLT